MIWLVIINPATEKIRLVQCFDYEAREYDFFPDENSDPIYFTEHQYALAWIQDNIKEDLIDIKCENTRHIPLRAKYLKS